LTQKSTFAYNKNRRAANATAKKQPLRSFSMYSENNRRSTTRRADDAFLRRMLGGELTGDGFPVVNTSPATAPTPLDRPAPQTQNGNLTRCDGSTAQHGGNTCPTTLHAPAIAMVYAPMQCWKNLFDPATGLSHGTIFQELVLPLGSFPENAHKEVNPHRPM
jgi:hypothetical protein